MAEIRLQNRKAGATFVSTFCTACRKPIGNRETPVIVEEHMGVYTSKRYHPFHRNCHPSIVDKIIAKMVADFRRTRGGRPYQAALPSSSTSDCPAGSMNVGGRRGWPSGTASS
jgi:hypothetical protein